MRGAPEADRVAPSTYAREQLHEFRLRVTEIRLAAGEGPKCMYTYAHVATAGVSAR